MTFQHLKLSRNVGDNEYTSNIYKTEFDKNTDFFTDSSLRENGDEYVYDLDTNNVNNERPPNQGFIIPYIIYNNNNLIYIYLCHIQINSLILHT